MGAPSDTSNYIYRMGTAPNTRSAISQKNKVYGYMVGKKQFQQIGAVNEFGHDESRGVESVRGVGFGDQIAELVPGVTEPMTLTLNKTLMYAVNLFQTLGYRGGVEGLVRSLKHHRWAFDIRQELVFSEITSEQDMDGTAGNNVIARSTNAAGVLPTVYALLTFYEGCWLNSYSASYTSDAAIVTENSSVTVTDVIDGTSAYGEFVDTGLSPYASDVGAEPGLGYSLRYSGSRNVNTGAETLAAGL